MVIVDQHGYQGRNIAGKEDLSRAVTAILMKIHSFEHLNTYANLEMDYGAWDFSEMVAQMVRMVLGGKRVKLVHTRAHRGFLETNRRKDEYGSTVRPTFGPSEYPKLYEAMIEQAKRIKAAVRREVMNVLPGGVVFFAHTMNPYDIVPARSEYDQNGQYDFRNYNGNRFCPGANERSFQILSLDHNDQLIGSASFHDKLESSFAQQGITVDYNNPYRHNGNTECTQLQRELGAKRVHSTTFELQKGFCAPRTDSFAGLVSGPGGRFGQDILDPNRFNIMNFAQACTDAIVQIVGTPINVLQIPNFRKQQPAFVPNFRVMA